MFCEFMIDIEKQEIFVKIMFVYGVKTDSHKRISKQNSENIIVHCTIKCHSYIVK